MTNPYTLTSTIGPSYQLNLDDVLRTKYTLQSLGYYTPRPHGMTKYPERELFDAIKRFQADNGLYADGIIRPGGQSERVLQAHAATATPTQPDRSAPIRRPSGKPLQQVPTVGGAHIPMPRPEQSALSKKKKKTGTYIWRTRGDGKVRSSHAERDGKVFSWASPPEGGPPGKDYGCRCWAENLGPVECERLQAQLRADQANADAAYKRWSEANDRYNVVVDKLTSKINELDDTMKRAAVESVSLARPIARLAKNKPVNPGDFAGPIPALLEIRDLRRKVAELQKKYDEALSERQNKEKDMNKAGANYSDTYAQYVALGCDK